MVATSVCHLSNRNALSPCHVTQDGENSKSRKEAGAAVSDCDNDSVPEISNTFYQQVEEIRPDCTDRVHEAAHLPDDVVVELIVRCHRK